MISNRISLTVAFYVIVVVNAKTVYEQQKCESQEDCPSNFCCSKRIFSDEAYCVAMRKENEICLDDDTGSLMINGLYDITCPCAENLKCIRDEYMAPDRRLYNLGLPRCRRAGYSGYNPRRSGNPIAFQGYNNELD